MIDTKLLIMNLRRLLFIAISIPIATCLAGLVIIILIVRMIQNDNPLAWAREAYPLGQTQSYIIQKNLEIKSSEGEVVMEEGTYYTFVLPGETSQGPMNSGRQIGRLSLDIEPFLNKEVYIEGDFYEGRPFVLDNKPLPAGYYWDGMIVMQIDSVKEK